MEHTHPNPAPTTGSNTNPLLRLNSVRRAASTSRTSGRFAVDPSGRSLTPTPHSALPNNRRKGRSERSTNKNQGLTGPTPSGMTDGVEQMWSMRLTSTDPNGPELR